MTPEIKQAMEARLAELEPEAAQLWEDYKWTEKQIQPHVERMEIARSKWSNVWEELQWIKRRLGKEA